MRQYPKIILSIQQQIQSYIDAGLDISSVSEAEKALTTIGFYRLRGYSFHLYDNATKQYQPNTKFSDILSIYQFDVELSQLSFSLLSAIEIALRVRLKESLLLYNDPLILSDPTVFDNKPNYWKNESKVATEINRSSDVFIVHNMDNYDGQIPIWAAVEVMSFGTLSRIIKNLVTGKAKTTGGASTPATGTVATLTTATSPAITAAAVASTSPVTSASSTVPSPDAAFSALSAYYSYKTLKGNVVNPSKKLLTSWIQSACVLRNVCAHNGRIYNRVIPTTPELIDADKMNPQPKFNGFYQIALAMKYLRPTDQIWVDFAASLKQLINKYSAVIDITRMNFPTDWESHFAI